MTGCTALHHDAPVLESTVHLHALERPTLAADFSAALQQSGYTQIISGPWPLTASKSDQRLAMTGPLRMAGSRQQIRIRPVSIETIRVYEVTLTGWYGPPELAKYPLAGLNPLAEDFARTQLALAAAATNQAPASTP